MQGSEKHVKWAEQIKGDFLKKLAAGQNVKGGFIPEYPEEEYKLIIEAANKRTEASWWIDRRLDGVGRMASNVLGRSPRSNSVL